MTMVLTTIVNTTNNMIGTSSANTSSTIVTTGTNNTTGTTSSYGSIGFTSNLKECIDNYQYELDVWYKKQINNANTKEQTVVQQYQQEQNDINTICTQLDTIIMKKSSKQQQQQNESTSTSTTTEGSQQTTSPTMNNSSTSTSIVNQQQIQTLDKENNILRTKIDTIKNKIQELNNEQLFHTERIEDAKKLRTNIECMKHVTINDLTRGILNYKYLGLDFEKASNGRLRFTFTQLNPNKPNERYSFELGVQDEIWCIENIIQPITSSNGISQSTINEWANHFNQTDDMTTLVRTIRCEFLQQIQQQ